MKHLYNSTTTLQTESRVRIEANYNRTIHGMTKPGDILFYKAPSDPAEHPMYVDAEGRNVPVDPATLQPMTDVNGNVLDVNGTFVPPYDIDGFGVHIDDVRIAMTSSDFDVKDQDGKEIFIAYDGEVIPTNDNGVPNTTLVGGEAWVIGADGQPHAPLERVFPLSSYANPVRAQNVPVNKNGTIADKVEDEFPEYFDINSIVESNRPRKRGALIAWTAADTFDNAVSSGLHGYNGARFYAADENMKYKYWTSPGTSEAVGVASGASVTTLDASWTTTGTNKTVAANFLSADFPTSTGHFQKMLSLLDGQSYEMDFTVMAQSTAAVKVELIEWTDTQGATPNYETASKVSTQGFMHAIILAGTSRTFSLNLTPSANTKSHALRITVDYVSTVAPKVSLSNMSVIPVTYPISGVGPRALYDRPLDVNKIVIGVDYSIDETILGTDSYGNKPGDSEVLVYVDRGDGLFVWEAISDTPEIDEDGHITLFYDGSGWGQEPQYGATQPIMGVQYAVYGMRRRDARVNIMEISARRTYDVSELLLSYGTDSEVSDDSFVLPFGTVNSNTGSLTLSNHDGRFNSDNKYLLDRARSTQSDPVFTNELNPFYQMLNESVNVEIDTATFVPGDEDKQFLRMITASTGSDLSPGNSMSAELGLRDDSKILEGIEPAQTFYSGPTMSVVQVLYMLLDSVGFTSVAFSDEDEHFSAHVGYFWTSKDDDNVWSIIEEVCRATQTVAFFDEFNVLHFKSLKGMYIDALSKSPAQVFTTEDLPGVYSNIQQMELEDKVSVNRVNVNYREIAEHDKSASGVEPAEVVWEPEGTEVLRAAPVLRYLNDQQIGSGSTDRLNFPTHSTKTWPFSGMVQVEGEFIKFDGKEYKWHDSTGKAIWSWVHNLDEQKEFDSRNEYLVHKNLYSGGVKITERGAEGTTIREHKTDPLSSFTRRYRNGAGTTKTNYSTGISVKNSKLYITAAPAVSGSTFVTVSDLSLYDDRPSHIGTRLRMSKGGYAGIAFGLNSPNDDGIFVEIGTTESVENAGRPRGELRFLTKINGVMKYWGFGVDVPISKNKDYDLDVSVKDGGHLKNVNDYTRFFEITLKYGDKGANVRSLQTALNLHNAKLAVDGSFGTATRDAVKRVQRTFGLTQDGIVAMEEWRAMQSGTYDVSVLSISATIDGTYTAHIQIPKSELANGYQGGRFGVFTRASTNAQFEYMYATRGQEDIEFDDSMFFDYIKGGYVSDQLDAGWIYNTRLKTYTSAGKRVTRERISNQLYMQDFGPIAHEVRDYDVVFDKEAPSLSSFMYFSNESQVHLTDYLHRPFGAKFRLANKARHDAVLNGEDSVTFGPDDAVEQRFLIYGRTLKIEDQRGITVSNQTSVNSRGAEELSIDVNWVQSKQAAEKLGSHIVEAMSHPVSTFSLDVFGHPGIRVGQIVSVYNPQLGVGSADDPESANRFFVYGVNHNNNGKPSTNLSLRQVINGGKREIALSDVLARNNNAMNMNPNIESYTKVGTVYKPTGYQARSGVKMAFKAPVQLTENGGGAAELTGTGGSAYDSAILASTYPDGIGRFDHPYGEHYLVTASVTAATTVAVALFMEGRETSGGGVTELASKTMVINAGETARIFLKGRFLSNAAVPELEVTLRLLNPADTTQGALVGQRAYVNDFFYRASQSSDDIYPIVGGEALKKL